MVHNVWVLLWKNLLIRKHHIIATVAEIFVPIGLVLLINISLPSIHKISEQGKLGFPDFIPEQCDASHYNDEIIMYEPDTPFVQNIMKHAACYAGYRSKVVKPGNLSAAGSNFTIGIKFENASSSAGNTEDVLSYTLYPTNPIWLYMNVAWRHLGIFVPIYQVALHDVIELQRAIDLSYCFLNGDKIGKVDFQSTAFFDRGPKVLAFIVTMIFFFVICLMIPNVIARIVNEKNSGAKELMLMMGVTRLQLWFSKFVEAYFFAFLAVTGVIILLYVPLAENSNVLQVSFIYFWCVCMYGIIGLILYYFFLSCFFLNASFAVFVAEIIAIFLLILYNFLATVITFPVVVKYMLSLFPQVTLINGITVLMDYDYYEKEVKLTERLSLREDYSVLLEVLLFMTINIFLFAVLTWYTEQVKAGKYGVPQPYTFCFKKAYWRRERVESVENGVNLHNLNQENFEVVPQNLKPGVTLTNVSKIYKTSKREPTVAVNDVTLNFYVSEISALLGHNGAGKTTVFSLITGLTYPSSGKVFINGYDLSQNIKHARRDLGMCPQQDMLFFELTATENILFFGMIKGLSLKQASSEEKELAKKLNLIGVRNTKSSRLSGGQKRKVSLAIALIGGSKILVLDEPSSGLDPEMRREIWELLQSLRGDKTILLTTHFMEEAEALSDRIAIMDQGKVVSFGSSLYLKSKYNQGYTLSVVKTNADNVQKLTDFIKKFIPKAKFKSQNIRTVKYEIPLNEINKFPKLLNGLDGAQKKNEIVSYSISYATLEDVFLSLRSKNATEEIEDDVDAPAYKKLREEAIESGGNGEKHRVSPYLLPPYQFCVLLLKKYIDFKRRIFTFLAYCLLPICLLLFLVALENKVRNYLQPPPELDGSRPINYTTSLYAPFKVLLASDGGDNAKNASKFLANLNCTPVVVSDIEKEIQNTYQKDFYEYARSIILGIEYLKDEVKIYYNDDAVFIIPLALNILHNIDLNIHNLHKVITTAVDTKYVKTEEEFRQAVQNVDCKFTYIPEFISLQIFYYLLGPVREYINGSKHIQLMMTPAYLYWLTHLLFDVTTFVIYLIPVCIIFNFLDNSTLLARYLGEIFWSLFFWGMGLITVTYVVAKIVRHEAGGLVVLVMLHVFFTFIVSYPFISMHLPDFVPYLYPSSILQLFLKSLCNGKPERIYLLDLFIYDVIMFTILLLLESSFWRDTCHRLISLSKCSHHEDKEWDEDELVLKERREVESIIDNNKTSEHPLVVQDLKRWYLVKKCKAKTVVRGITFHVTEGECFGLLGVNGAGKTTTFRMLTGEITPSSGKLYVDSRKLHSCRKKKSLRQISYCPQNGGLLPSFHGREFLLFIGRLRGLYGPTLMNEVDYLLNKLDLQKLANKSCGTYSGGNQRKLSTAAAVIGDTRLTFLDEPTTGVDPISRRLTWNLINQTQKRGRSFILTSHSMDECEALCSRLAIMVNGNFRCIGELATLKERFGEGFIVELKISNNAPEASVNAIKKAMIKNFEPGISLVDDHLTLLQYKIDNPKISWADLFKNMNSLKHSNPHVESYGASSTTLEQIFISFARKQK